MWLVTSTDFAPPDRQANAEPWEALAANRNNTAQKHVLVPDYHNLHIPAAFLSMARIFRLPRPVGSASITQDRRHSPSI